VISVEMKGAYGRRVFTGPDDQLEGLQVLTRCAGDALLAFCFMSTHIHALLDDPEARRIIRRVRRELDATADRRGVARFDEPHIEILSDAHAALRYAAYTHANPVKAGMVVDPLAWPLSSHRDAMGVRSAPWYSPARLLALGSELRDPVNEWLHRHAEGRSLLRQASVEPLTWPTEPLDLIARSTRAVYGLTEAEWQRRRRGAPARHCFVTTAELRGWRRAEIASYLEWTERHGRRVCSAITPEVRSTLLILADARLRPTSREWWFVPAAARGPRLWKEWWDEIRSPAPSPAPRALDETDLDFDDWVGPPDI
jgi:hypothetical protein